MVVYEVVARVNHTRKLTYSHWQVVVLTCVLSGIFV